MLSMRQRPPDPARLYDLIRLVRPVYLTLYRAVDAGLAGSGLTVGERAILEMLHDGGPAPVPELAGRLDLERQPIQRTVDGLRARGLVERGDNPRHRRSLQIRLTAGGTRAIVRVLEREAVQLARVARGLEAASLEQAIAVVSAVLAAFNPDRTPARAPGGSTRPGPGKDAASPNRRGPPGPPAGSSLPGTSEGPAWRRAPPVRQVTRRRTTRRPS
jgi:DNA-binding MarR family transcriptional regulator